MEPNAKWLNIRDIADAVNRGDSPETKDLVRKDDLFFLIRPAADSRYTLSLADQKGQDLFADPIHYSGQERIILTRWNRIRGKESLSFSWNGESSSPVFLDEHTDFVDILLRTSLPLCFGKSEDRIAMKTETEGRLFLTVEKADNESHRTYLSFHGAGKKYESPLILSSRHILAEGFLFRCVPGCGADFSRLSRFEGQIATDDLELLLTLFSSYFPEVEIDYRGYGFRIEKEVRAERGLQFSALDEEGNLHLSLLWGLSPYPEDFINQNRPGQIIHIDQGEKTVISSPVIYDSSKEDIIPRLLKKYLKKRLLPENDSFYIPAEQALPFLTENLGKLAGEFPLFGTEALEKFRLKPVRPIPQIRLSSGIDFFEGECLLELENDVMPLDKALKLFEENNFIPLTDGSRAIVDRKFFNNLLRVLGKLNRKNQFKVSFFDLPLIDQLIEGKTEGEEFVKSRTFFEGFNSLNSKRLSKNIIKGELRDYQKYGVKWLNYLKENNLGGCLADDMGLGKTIQTITMLAADYKSGKEKGPSLIVMPRSLLTNWKAELGKFAPGLSVYVYHGGERDLEPALGHQIILTTYSLVRNDIELLEKVRFNFLVLDEIQAIKNINSRIAKAVMLLNGDHRFGLSGTPMENHVGELYSVFRFLNPPMFGTFADFSRRFMNPIQKQNDTQASRLLAKKISPFILRRLKQDVAKELPPRTEQLLYADMDDSQAALYEERREFYRQTIKSAVAREGFGKSGFLILQGLMELRQLASIPEAKTEGEITSPKWPVFLDHLSEIIDAGHRCLVFTNFLSTVELLSEKLEEQGTEHLVMTGSTENRAELVDLFQESHRYKVFLMTLKTGGVGLNLTGADYVYILDPWWNRSAEQQAIDRTHRIGQTKNIFSYRVITRGTIEEKILELQEQKKELFSSLISSDGQLMKKLSEEDIDYLLRERKDFHDE